MLKASGSCHKARSIELRVGGALRFRLEANIKVVSRKEVFAF
jgi:hypothetical protein